MTGQLLALELIFEGYYEEMFIDDCEKLSATFDRARELVKALKGSVDSA